MPDQPRASSRRRKSARPRELLDAALATFVERGFAAARPEEIALRAGVSKGTLYLYYASKEDLFKAVVRQNIVPLIEAFQRDVAESDASSSELLREFFVQWWTCFGATKLAGICKLVVGEAGNFPELARFFQFCRSRVHLNRVDGVSATAGERAEQRHGKHRRDACGSDGSRGSVSGTVG